jgi:hypothetical protein
MKSTANLSTEGRTWLVEITPSGEWTSYRAVLCHGWPVNKRRRIYWLGHNGHRWARASDLRDVKRQFPELLEQVAVLIG